MSEFEHELVRRVLCCLAESVAEHPRADEGWSWAVENMLEDAAAGLPTAHASPVVEAAHELVRRAMTLASLPAQSLGPPGASVRL